MKEILISFCAVDMALERRFELRADLAPLNWFVARRYQLALLRPDAG